jgi:hypothetical protein
VGVLKGHGFQLSRTMAQLESGFSRRGNTSWSKHVASGAKAQSLILSVLAQLKPRPFKATKIELY